MITTPKDFNDAIGFLLDKEQRPTGWNHEEWAAQGADVRNKAFFSANVESARFLDRAQGMIFDYMAKVRDTVTTPEGTSSTALRVSGREHFVRLMRDFMVEEGMVAPEEIQHLNQDDVKPLASMSRLRLIFDTNVRQGFGFGQWKQSMTPAALARFPAARLVRVRGVMEQRPRHAENIGQVVAKTDFEWWANYQNAPEIGGFGVPWGPFGFNSGTDTENVSREEADRLRVPIPADNDFPLPGLNDGLSASVRSMSPGVKAALLAELRGGPKAIAPAERGRAAAAEVRKEMLGKGLSNALAGGNILLASKYRAALDSMLDGGAGFSVRESDGRIYPEF